MSVCLPVLVTCFLIKKENIYLYIKCFTKGNEQSSPIVKFCNGTEV